jgi:hypothetical protein
MASPGEKKFWLLRRLSRGFTAGAWVVLALVLVVTPVAVARALMQHDQDSLIEWLQYGASGLLIFVNLIWLAQSIQVVVAIEENTRHTGYVLERLTTLAQQIRDRLPERGDEDHGPTAGPRG